MKNINGLSFSRFVAAATFGRVDARTMKLLAAAWIAGEDPSDWRAGR